MLKINMLTFERIRRGEMLYNKILELRSENHGKFIQGAEIGVGKGDLSRYLLTRLPFLRLMMVDSWTMNGYDVSYVRDSDGSPSFTVEKMEANYHKAIKNTQFAEDRVVIVKKASIEAARNILDGFLDFVFIDADHRYRSVLSDLKAWYPKVRKSGLISGHDWDRPVFSVLWRVREAVTDFVKQNNLDVNIELKADYVWCFRKP